MAEFVEIDVHNAVDIADDYFAVAENVEDLAPPFREAMRFIEFTHERHFGRLKGRYVRTGATKESLTTAGPGAIRDVEDQQAIFGTSVWYAHFLTKGPHDPNSGQVRKENRPDLKSAVLVFSRTTQRKVAEMIMGHVAEPFG